MNRVEAVFGYVGEEGAVTTFQYWGQDGDAGRSEKIEIMYTQMYGSLEVGTGTRTEISGEFDEAAFVVSIIFRR